MATLSTRSRNKLPVGKFAGLDRSYPIPDKSHAANAKARATQAVDAGRMSSSEKAKIDAKANKVLGQGNRSATRGVARELADRLSARDKRGKW